MEVTGHSDGTLWTKALYHGTLWNDKEPSLINDRRRWTSVKIWSPSLNMVDRFSRGTQSNKQTNKQNKTSKQNITNNNKTKTNKTKQTKPTNRPFFVSSLFLLVVHIYGLSHLSRSLCELMCSLCSNYYQCVHTFSSNL